MPARPTHPRVQAPPAAHALCPPPASAHGSVWRSEPGNTRGGNPPVNRMPCGWEGHLRRGARASIHRPCFVFFSYGTPGRDRHAGRKGCAWKLRRNCGGRRCDTWPCWPPPHVRVPVAHSTTRSGVRREPSSPAIPPPSPPPHPTPLPSARLVLVAAADGYGSPPSPTRAAAPPPRHPGRALPPGRRRSSAAASAWPWRVCLRARPLGR